MTLGPEFQPASESGRREPRTAAHLIDQLLRHDYTTNIRELDALLWRAMSASTGDVIEWDASELPAEPKDRPATRDQPTEDENPPRVPEPSEAEVRAALAEHQGNVARAAKAMQLSSRYVLYRLMKKYGIETV